MSYRVLFLLAIVGLGSVLAFSVTYRLAKGKPIFRPSFAHVRFLETWRSGRSPRDALTRLSPRQRWLWVAVTNDELWVSPHFPFTLLFLPEAFHLDFRIPGKTIIQMTEKESAGNHLVLIRFRHATGEEDSLEIVVENIATFRNAIAAIRAEDRRRSAPRPGQLSRES